MEEHGRVKQHINNSTSQYILKKAKFHLFKVPKTLQVSDPAWIWTYTRFLPNYAKDRTFERGALDFDNFSSSAMTYLAAGMYENKENRRYHKAEKLLLSAFFSLVDLSDENTYGLSFKKVKVDNHYSDLMVEYTEQFTDMNVDTKERFFKNFTKEFWAKKSLLERKTAYWTVYFLRNTIWKKSGRPKRVERSEQFNRYYYQILNENLLQNIIYNDRNKKHGLYNDGTKMEFGYSVYRPISIWE